jgi:hypothetical protein
VRLECFGIDQWQSHGETHHATCLGDTSFLPVLVESGGKRRAGLAAKSVYNTRAVLRKALADAERLDLVARNVASSAQANSAPS